jgi:hypothetical protein
MKYEKREKRRRWEDGRCGEFYVEVGEWRG